jgi:hypothetical protein
MGQTPCKNIQASLTKFFVNTQNSENKNKHSILNSTALLLKEF